MFHQYKLFSIIIAVLWGLLTTVIGITIFHDFRYIIMCILIHLNNIVVNRSFLHNTEVTLIWPEYSVPKTMQAAHHHICDLETLY